MGRKGKTKIRDRVGSSLPKFTASECSAYRAIGGCAGGAVTTGRTGVDRMPPCGADLTVVEDAGDTAELTGRPEE